MPKGKQYHHGDLKNALIEAGIEILSQEGLHALSLRKTAQKAGVSHTAPYAHFSDKQALIAAICTEGFKHLYADLKGAMARYEGNPLSQLVEGAWAYIEFATKNTEIFKIMFSSALEKEKDYPALVDITQITFGLVVEVVKTNQKAGILRPTPPELMAVSIWSSVHGLISLILEGQVSHTLLDQFTRRQILSHTLSQFCLVEAPNFNS
jgi:AcrR family transcriptional regulator